MLALLFPYNYIPGLFYGLLCTIMGLISLVSIFRFRKRAICVKGVVVDIHMENGVYYPLVQFELHGIKRTFRGSGGSTLFQYMKWQRVEVLVDPSLAGLEYSLTLTLLNYCLRTSIEIDAFVCDHFEDVYKSFSPDMTREHKLYLLLGYQELDLYFLLMKLKDYFPEICAAEQFNSLFADLP